MHQTGTVYTLRIATLGGEVAGTYATDGAIHWVAVHKIVAADIGAKACDVQFTVGSTVMCPKERVGRTVHNLDWYSDALV